MKRFERKSELRDNLRRLLVNPVLTGLYQNQETSLCDCNWCVYPPFFAIFRVWLYLLSYIDLYGYKLMTVKHLPCLTLRSQF